MSRRLDFVASRAEIPGSRPRVSEIAQLIQAVIEGPADLRELRALAGILGSAQAEIPVRVAEMSQPKAEGRLLTAHEAAVILSMPVRSVYREAHRWPFTRHPTPGLLRFDEVALRAWISGGRK